MIVSPSNIIEGLIAILKANAEGIDELIRHYSSKSRLHLFKGIRKTLPLTMMPSLELEQTSGSMDWVTTSAMTGEYTIDCVLTAWCGNNVEIGAEYMAELTRRVVQVYNYPPNMTWAVPNEWLDREKTVPLHCVYSAITNVDYGSAKEFSIRVARWQMSCRTLEPFPEPEGLAPQKAAWKTDVLPGETT